MDQLDREDVVNALIDQLKRVPNEELCRTVITEEQIMTVAEQVLNFQKVTDYLLKNDLEIERYEIPDELWFEMILFMAMEGNANSGGFWIVNDEIFADPEEIVNFISERFPELKEVIEQDSDCDFAYMNIGEMLAALRQ